MTTQTAPLQTKGLVLHSEARYYDLLAWLLTLGRERAFRERLTEIVALKRGDSALDVGCGTGSLAITAKRRVGDSGVVVGIDASPEMIERAKQKALNAGVEARFETAVVEALPFPDASFDVVFSTLMLHHLPRPVREQCAREMRRVAKPEGRILAVDFATPASERRGLFASVHRHGGLALPDIVQLLREAGLRPTAIGAVGVSDLQFVLAAAPNPNDSSDPVPPSPATRSLGPLPAPRWIWVAPVIVLVAAHAVVIGGAWSLGISAVALASVIAGIVLLHWGGIGAIHAVLRRRRR